LVEVGSVRPPGTEPRTPSERVPWHQVTLLIGDPGHVLPPAADADPPHRDPRGGVQRGPQGGNPSPTLLGLTQTATQDPHSPRLRVPPLAIGHTLIPPVGPEVNPPSLSPRRNGGLWTARPMGGIESDSDSDTQPDPPLVPAHATPVIITNPTMTPAADSPARPDPAGPGGSFPPGSALLDENHSSWIFLRRIPLEVMAMRVPLIGKKYLDQPRFAEFLDSAYKLAGDRMGLHDVDSHADGLRLVLLAPRMLFGKDRPSSSDAPVTTAWIDTVTGRLHRLLAGDFEGLLKEVTSQQGNRNQPPVSTPKKVADAKVLRSLDLMHDGNISKALGCLGSGGILDVTDAEVQDEFAALLSPHNSPPVSSWRDFVDTPGRNTPSSNSPVYNFILGSSRVPDSTGGLREVCTLSHVLSTLDRSAAAGISGAPNRLLRNTNADVIRPLLEPFFGRGKWSYSRSVLDANGNEIFYHRDTHALLVSVLGIALDKDGKGHTPGTAVSNLRPIGIGESLRRIAARCQLLQCEYDIGVQLSKEGQFGCGFARGTDTVYHLVSKSLDAFVAANVACGTSENDAKNAFGSIFRSKIQLGILEVCPHLLPTFDFLYGPESSTFAKCFLYSASSATPIFSCRVPDGVQQGDVFGPLFFSLGIRGLLKQIRHRMRNLKVDSTMVGQRVVVAVDSIGTRTDPSGVSLNVPLHANTPLILISAPSYADCEDSTDADSVLVEVSTLDDPVPIRVPRGILKLEAEILLAAYLDDIKLPAELHLLRPFTQALSVLGPEYGLFFIKRAKNYLYVPKTFLSVAQLLFPDAAFATDESPGSSTDDKLKGAAASLDPHRNQLLISTIGIPRLMGAPFRCVADESSPDHQGDNLWYEEELSSLLAEQAKRFAHLGLEEVDVRARHLLGDSYSIDVPRLPCSESQIQFLIGKYALSPRLSHVASKVPTSLALPTLSKYDVLSVAVAAGVMGKSLHLDESLPPTSALTATQTLRLGLPPTEGGCIPTAAPVAPKSLVSSLAAVEKYAIYLGSELATSSGTPKALQLLLDRLATRSTVSSRTYAEKDAAACVREINIALAALHRTPALLVPEPASPGHPPPVPDLIPPGIPQLDFAALHSTLIRPRRMGDALWRSRVRDILSDSPAVEQQSLRSARIPGSARFLEAIPMAAAFNFAPEDFRAMLCRYLTVPDVPLPWRHSCGNSGTTNLDEVSFRHLYSCPCLGRLIGTHDEAKYTLAHAIHLCGHSSSLPLTETKLSYRGETWNADIAYFAGGLQWVLDVAVVNVDSDTSVHAGSRAEDIEAILSAEEAKRKRENKVIRGLQIERGNNIIFVPFVMASTGGFGGEARSFLKTIFNASKMAGKFHLGVGERSLFRPLDTTWNTAVASRYWEMRLSVAVTLADASLRKSLVERDLSSGLRVAGRQPHPDPNFSTFARPNSNSTLGDARRHNHLSRSARASNTSGTAGFTTAPQTSDGA
jgi:hypothetical protein